MNDKQADCIIEVARMGKISTAARQLFMSPSTLSYQVSEVERELGFKIFERHGHGMELTSAGLVFVADLRDIRGRIDMAIARARKVSERSSQTIVVGAVNRTSVSLLPIAIKRFRKASPDFEVHVRYLHHYIVDPFAVREVDILCALRDQVVTIPDIELTPFVRSSIYLVTSHGDPLSMRETVTAQDLSSRRLLFDDHASDVMRKVYRRVSMQAEPIVIHEPDHDSLMTDVALGDIALVPGFLKDGSKEFVWIPFQCDDHIHGYACTRASESRPAVRQLVEILVDTYKRTPLPTL